MPAFTAPDGTELAYHVVGEGEPLLCLPGGPMRASAYLGDLGGLARPNSPSSRTPATSPGSTTPASSAGPSEDSSQGPEGTMRSQRFP
jgi:hypothetical protein